MDEYPYLAMNRLARVARPSVALVSRAPGRLSSFSTQHEPRSAGLNARNAVLGISIVSFVGGVYYYTVSKLRQQEAELNAELERAAAELENMPV